MRFCNLISIGLVGITTGCEVRPVVEQKTPDRPANTPSVKREASRAPVARYLSGAEGEFTLESQKGRPLLVALLGAGLRDSEKSVLVINKLHEEFQSSGLVTIGLLAALAPDEDPRAVADSFRAYFPIAEAAPGLLPALGGVRALPSLVLVDARGAVRKQLPGAVDLDEARAQLRDLIAESK